MFAFTKWTIIKNSLPFFLFAHFLRGLIHFMLAVCYAFAFPRSPLHFPASTLPIASTLRCTLCTISLFSHFFFRSILEYYTLTLYPFLLCTRNKEASKEKNAKTFIFFPDIYTMVHMCVFFNELV